MDPKIELYASLCSVLEHPDAKKEIWDILAGYTVNAVAAYSSLENSIKEFLDAKRADSLSEKSILNYKQILTLFQQWKDIPPSLVTTDDIRGWMSYLKEDRGMKKDSVQTYLNCLRSFFGWLYTEEKIRSNPTTRIKSAHIDKVSETSHPGGSRTLPFRSQKRKRESHLRDVPIHRMPPVGTCGYQNRGYRLQCP